MEIKKIYFDLDGVLADFDRGVEEILGLLALPQTAKTEAQDDELFAAMAKADHFYDHLNFMPGAEEMFRKIYDKYGDKVEILSGIPKPRRNVVTAGADKRSWVKRELSDKLVVNIVYREEKKDYCTGKDCILIDDFEKNIQEWEQMGGTGILYTDPDEVIKKLI